MWKRSTDCFYSAALLSVSKHNIVLVNRFSIFSKASLRLSQAARNLTVPSPFPKSPISNRCFSTAIEETKSSQLLNSNEPVITSSLSESIPSPQLQSLVESICKLSLLETHQLVTALRKKLGIENNPFPLGMIGQHLPLNQSTTPSNEQTPTQPTKTDFKLVLEKFEPTSKAKVIKEVKTLFPQMNLVEAKNFVESLPKVIKEKASREEAERLLKVFDAIGAAVKME